MRPIYYQICILALMSRQTKPRVVVSDRVTYQLFSLFFFFFAKIFTATIRDRYHSAQFAKKVTSLS